MTSPLRDHHASDSGPVVGSVCTGYGGLDLGVLAALGGGRIAWVADSDPHIAQILDARMPDVLNLGDLRLIDWAAVESVDVLVAGFPCQDISAAGRRAGIEKGTRSGLWTDIVAGFRVLRPALVVVENVAALRWKGGGLHRVLGDLAEAGYDAFWRSVRAADIGAAHRRERVFLLAWHRHAASTDAANTAGTRRRPPRACRPGAPSRPRTPGELARRGQRPRHAAADPDGLGREKRHPPDPDRWTLAARRVAAVADPTSLRHWHSGPHSRTGFPAAAVAAGAPAGGPRGVPADATSDGRDERLSGAARFQGRPDAALGGHPPVHPTGAQPGRRKRHRRQLVAAPAPGESTANWGVYETAIRRWEAVLGRPIPHPTQPGNHGRPVLAPAFVEHLMGLTEGWVTELSLPRTAQLRALGNGVVPQQAAYAVSLLLDDLAELLDVNTDTGTATDHRSPTGQEVTAA